MDRWLPLVPIAQCGLLGALPQFGRASPHLCKPTSRSEIAIRRTVAIAILKTRFTWSMRHHLHDRFRRRDYENQQSGNLTEQSVGTSRSSMTATSTIAIMMNKRWVATPRK
jgi:hypothetical protein